MFGLQKEDNTEKEFILTKKHFIFFGIFFSLCFSLLLIMPVSGDDYWWHIKIGEWIVNNKAVPKTGLFSWYGLENNLSWFAHEWLAEVFIYQFASLFGGNLGGIIYLLMCVILLGTLLYCFNYKDYLKHLGFSCIWMVIGFLAVATVCTARPHMMTLSFFCILVYVCEKMKNPNWKGFYLFPLLTIIWANYHGGSSNITYIIPIMYFITNSFNFNFGRISSTKVAKSFRYLILAGINIVAILLNPRTYELLWYPYSYTEEHAKYILEWKSPSFTNGGFALFIIIFICCIFFVTKRKIEFSDLALVGTFMLLTLKSIRFDAWLFVATTMVIYKYIAEMKDKSMYSFLCYEFALLGIGFLLYTFYSISVGDTYVQRGVSEEAIEIIKEREPKHLMNYYDFGSYLIYEEIPVFIDGRADMYTGYNFKQAAEGIYFDKEHLPEDMLKEFDFDMYLLPPTCYLAYWLENNGYENLYEDEKVVLLVPKALQNTSETSSEAQN